MNDIIPVLNELIGSKEVNAVDARTLHEWLGVKTKFTDWIKNRISDYNFDVKKDYITFSEKKEKGRPIDVYFISLNMAKELAMIERTPKGKEARQYFIRIEDRFLKLQKRILEQKATSEWQLARETGKIKRRDLTDAISPFIIYALEQKSKGTANNAYSNFTRLINKECGLIAGEREKITPKMLSRVAALEGVVEMKIVDLMREKVYCKDIFATIRDETLPTFCELVPYHGDRYLPDSKNERIE